LSFILDKIALVLDPDQFYLIQVVCHECLHHAVHVVHEDSKSLPYGKKEDSIGKELLTEATEEQNLFDIKEYKSIKVCYSNDEHHSEIPAFEIGVRASELFGSKESAATRDQTRSQVPALNKFMDE